MIFYHSEQFGCAADHFDGLDVKETVTKLFEELTWSVYIC